MLYVHPEKYFVESTKIWLNQQSFSFKYGSMEILFELTKRIYCWFSLQFQQKKISSPTKKWNCRLKLQNYCRIKEKILLIEIKCNKFCWNFVKLLTIFFFSLQQIRLFTSTTNFAQNNQNVLNKTRFVVSINFFLWVFLISFSLFCT